MLVRPIITAALLALYAPVYATGPAIATNAPINGFEMYYEVWPRTESTGLTNQNDTLVVLHGFGASHTVWNEFIPEFTRNYSVIAVDLRGHGRSTNPLNQFTHRQSAQDVLALMDRLGIKKTRAMGISTGGMTLIHIATQAPDRLADIVLIGATTYFPEQAREIMRRSTVESLTPADWERMRRIHLHGDEQIKALRREFHNFKDSYDDMNFTGPLLSTITARTLIIHGDRDEFFPVNIPVELYRSIPHSYLWIVPNGGHVPIFGAATKPAFLAITSEFLSGSRFGKTK